MFKTAFVFDKLAERLCLFSVEIAQCAFKRRVVLLLLLQKMIIDDDQRLIMMMVTLMIKMIDE